VKLFLKRGCCSSTSLPALIAAVFFWSGTAHAASFYSGRPTDPRAVDFTAQAFGAHADGTGDDSDALQRAIDRVQETTGAGVLLIPEGRYLLSKTIYVWQGIRLLGYGATRPVFVLAKDTPGFQEGTGRYMVHFADNRPDLGAPIVDATEFTFYSGMSNIDFELQDGNPEAIAIRFHVAQHSELTHMNFRIGSARAAVEDIGNQASDIHVEGGEYGIITRRTAPVWQFLLMDSSFEGQRAAAIKTQEAGFTLIRVSFSNMPVALEVAPGEVEQLYGRDLQMQNIRDAVFVAGNARNAHSAVTLTNIACSDVPRFLRAITPSRPPLATT
jgi:Pectate lyase superfamily protein